MSSSPDSSPKPPKSATSDQSQISESAVPTQDSASESTGSEATTSPQASPPLLQRPPSRPVRPQPPPQPVASKPPVAATPTPKSEALTSEPLPIVTESPKTQAEPEASVRPGPIPPPSEPKQYRAIGMVYGQYTPEPEEFTRGTMVTRDGTVLKAVLLGRVMSLVRNHIDLQTPHLWVVYPRTREANKELHLQIVGVWEPATLKRSDTEETSSNGLADEKDCSPDDLAPTDLEDGYFSVRGEVVFYSPEQEQLVIKIQQQPRKNSQTGKAFKLTLKGSLDSTKTVGYFWDLNTRREDVGLVVTDGNCVGMTPPRKRSGDELAQKHRPPRRPFGNRPTGGDRERPSGDRRPIKPGVVRREPIAKPTKRSDQNPEGSSQS